MSWSRSVWLFCLDIAYGQSLRDTYSIMSLSDWTMCTWSDICAHGLNMTRCIELFKSQLQADHVLAFCDWFIRHRSFAPALTATCPLFPCMSVGHTWWQCWCVCDPTIQKMKFIQELSFINTHQYYVIYARCNAIAILLVTPGLLKWIQEFIHTLHCQGWVSSGRNLFLPGHPDKSGRNLFLPVLSG